MLSKFVKSIFIKKSVSKITKLSKENRSITESVIKEKPQIDCGIYPDLYAREKFYQKLFSVCNQL